MPKVNLRISDGIATLELDYPDKANCLTRAMAEEVQVLCDEIDDNREVGCVVVSGAGGTFCSGADREVLSEVAADPAEALSFASLGVIYESFQRVGRLSVPTIAAVRGAAVGAGVNLMLVADLRIVADDAVIQPGFQRLGLHPGGGHFTLLRRLVHADTSAAMGLFAAQMSGREAAERGLAWQSVEDDAVEALAHELAKTPASDPDLARYVVKSMRAQIAAAGLPWSVASDLERPYQMWSLRRSSMVNGDRSAAIHAGGGAL